MAHTDIKIPDFSKYRRPSNKDPKKKNKDSVDERRAFTYAISTFCGVLAAYSTKAVMLHYILFMAPSAEVLALAKIEIKLNEIPEGINATYKWRGK